MRWLRRLGWFGRQIFLRLLGVLDGLRYGRLRSLRRLWLLRWRILLMLLLSLPLLLRLLSLRRQRRCR